MADKTSHLLRTGGVTDLSSLIPLHVVVHHAVGDGSLPRKNRVHSVMKWLSDTFVSISVAIDSMLAPSVEFTGCDGLKFLPSEVMFAAVGDAIAK
jgi:hypothetical protein